MADRFSFRNPSNGDYTTIHPEIWKQEIKEKYDFATQTHDEIVIGLIPRHLLPTLHVQLLLVNPSARELSIPVS